MVALLPTRNAGGITGTESEKLEELADSLPFLRQLVDRFELFGLGSNMGLRQPS